MVDNRNSEAEDKFAAGRQGAQDGAQNGARIVYVVMGVSGSGKTTIGRMLAHRLDCPFHEGDEYHPPANREKMAGGTPLSDADRKPWIEAIGSALNAEAAPVAVLSCSALTRQVRDWLRDAIEAELRLIYPCANFQTLRKRMEARKDHFFKAGMLQSQFDALEEPGDDELFLKLKQNFPKRQVMRILEAIEAAG